MSKQGYLFYGSCPLDNLQPDGPRLHWLQMGDKQIANRKAGPNQTEKEIETLFREIARRWNKEEDAR